MAHAGSTDADLPEEELPGAESAPLECEEQARPDSRLYKKVMALNAFIDESAKGLSPSAALVWLALFRFARDGVAIVSQATIAERLGVDKKTVSRNIKTLQKRGLVEPVYQGGIGRGCNRYRLGIATLEKAKKQRKKKPKSETPESPKQLRSKDNKTPAHIGHRHLAVEMQRAEVIGGSIGS